MGSEYHRSAVLLPGLRPPLGGAYQSHSWFESKAAGRETGREEGEGQGRRGMAKRRKDTRKGEEGGGEREPSPVWRFSQNPRPVTAKASHIVRRILGVQPTSSCIGPTSVSANEKKTTSVQSDVGFDVIFYLTCLTSARRQVDVGVSAGINISWPRNSNK